MQWLSGSSFQSSLLWSSSALVPARTPTTSRAASTSQKTRTKTSSMKIFIRWTSRTGLIWRPSIRFGFGSLSLAVSYHSFGVFYVVQPLLTCYRKSDNGELESLKSSFQRRTFQSAPPAYDNHAFRPGQGAPAAPNGMTVPTPGAKLVTQPTNIYQGHQPRFMQQQQPNPYGQVNHYGQNPYAQNPYQQQQ